MADFPDSGVSIPNGPATPYPKFTSPIIERWNAMQLEQGAAQLPRTMGVEQVANELFSRLMSIATDGKQSSCDRIAASIGAWGVYSDYARLLNGD